MALCFGLSPLAELIILANVKSTRVTSNLCSILNVIIIINNHSIVVAHSCRF